MRIVSGPAERTSPLARASNPFPDGCFGVRTPQKQGEQVATNVDDIEFDETDDGNANESGGMKALRAQTKKLAADLKASNDALVLANTKSRAADLKEHLGKFEADPKIAKWAARDIEGDITEDSVKAWLEAEGSAFGWEAPQAQSEEQVANETAARRVSQVTKLAPEAAPASAPSVDAIKSLSFADMEASGMVKKFR